MKIRSTQFLKISSKLLALPLLVVLLSVTFSFRALANLEVGTEADLETASEDSAPTTTPVAQVFHSVLQCLGKGVGGRATSTAKAFAQAYEKAIAKGRAKNPSMNEIHHLIAQVLHESMHLQHLSEMGRSEKYKGRGYIQVTHKDGYENCAKFAREIGLDPKGLVNGGEEADALIGDKAKDLTLAAVCSLSWWQNAKRVSSRFSSAVERDSSTSVMDVSRAVNAGPGARVGHRINGLNERFKAFKEVGRCMPKR